MRTIMERRMIEVEEKADKRSCSYWIAVFLTWLGMIALSVSLLVPTSIERAIKALRSRV